MSSIFDWEVRRLGMRDTLKPGTITVLDLDIFTKIAVFCGEKNVSKFLGNTIHYTYTSYNKYFRLCLVSEELRLNEIGLFLLQYRLLSTYVYHMFDLCIQKHNHDTFHLRSDICLLDNFQDIARNSVPRNTLMLGNLINVKSE